MHDPSLTGKLWQTRNYKVSHLFSTSPSSSLSYRIFFRFRFRHITTPHAFPFLLEYTYLFPLLSLIIAIKSPSKMAPAPAAAGAYDVALNRRKSLMGASGPMALVQNLKVFGIACFACIGGLLYGYNQGVFSGILTMNNFMGRT